MIYLQYHKLIIRVDGTFEIIYFFPLTILSQNNFLSKSDNNNSIPSFSPPCFFREGGYFAAIKCRFHHCCLFVVQTKEKSRTIEKKNTVFPHKFPRKLFFFEFGHPKVSHKYIRSKVTIHKCA